MSEQSIFKIGPTIQHYDWGGLQFIPSLINQPITDMPCAELWMGDHPKSPSTVPVELNVSSLQSLIAKDPHKYLGPKSTAKFGVRLPFLFKVLDVRKMLSIQTHPTKQQAEIGFQNEEQAEIPLNAFDRVFKDDNHKPELMVALSPFYLLHGFRKTEDIITLFKSIKAFYELIHLVDLPMREMYESIMRLPQAQVNDILSMLKVEIDELGVNDKMNPHYWASQAISLYGNDRGVISIYLLNLVFLQPGESIFQNAGIPHAYLEGQNIEIMANSDNVFRGGLTTKHMDIDLLMQHLDIREITPQVLAGAPDPLGVKYSAPVDDFCLYKIMAQNQTMELEGPAIILVCQGEGTLETNKNMDIAKGDVIFICPETLLKFKGCFSGFLATSIF